MNWLPAQPEADVHAFTRFAHAPHFSLLDDKGCQTCHGLDPDADFMAGFQDMDPTSFASNFKPVARAVCGDCHVEELAGEACTICHNYHVGRIAPVMMRAPLAEAGKATSQ